MLTNMQMHIKHPTIEFYTLEKQRSDNFTAAPEKNDARLYIDSAAQRKRPVVRPKWWENQDVSGKVTLKIKPRKGKEQMMETSLLAAGIVSMGIICRPCVFSHHRQLPSSRSGPSNAGTSVSTPGSDPSLPSFHHVPKTRAANDGFFCPSDWWSAWKDSRHQTAKLWIWFSTDGLGSNPLWQLILNLLWCESIQKELRMDMLQAPIISTFLIFYF